MRQNHVWRTFGARLAHNAPCYPGGMKNRNSILLSLPDLADVLGLPKAWIKAEAEAGRIPHLKIGQRYRFNHDAVVHKLAERAAQQSEQGRSS